MPSNNDNEPPEFDAKKFMEERLGKLSKEKGFHYPSLEKDKKKPPRPPKKPTLLKEPLIVHPEKPPVRLEDVVGEIFEEPILEGFPISQILESRKAVHGMTKYITWMAEEYAGPDLVDREHIKGIQSSIINSVFKMLTMPESPKQRSREVDRLRLRVSQVFKPTEDAVEELKFNFKGIGELQYMGETEMRKKGLID